MASLSKLCWVLWIGKFDYRLVVWFEISIRFKSGSRVYIDMIGPTAPVLGTGPSSICICKCLRCEITSLIGADVIKQRSAEPGVGVSACGFSGPSAGWRLIFC